MDPGLLTLSLVGLTAVFAYIGTQTEPYNSTSAVLKMTNMMLAYLTGLVTLFHGIQIGNHTYLGSGILSPYTNIYAIIVMALFFMMLWAYMWKLKDTDDTEL